MLCQHFSPACIPLQAACGWRTSTGCCSGTRSRGAWSSAYPTLRRASTAWWWPAARCGWVASTASSACSATQVCSYSRFCSAVRRPALSNGFLHAPPLRLLTIGRAYRLGCTHGSVHAQRARCGPAHLHRASAAQSLLCAVLSAKCCVLWEIILFSMRSATQASGPAVPDARGMLGLSLA